MTTEISANEAKTSPKARRTRARLVAASREIFERDGFVDARVTDVASAAGVSHGTFYTYFTSKEEIFRALILDLFDSTRRPGGTTPVHDAESAYRIIHESNRSYAELIRDNGRLMNVWRQAATLNDEIRDLLRAEDEIYVSRAERGIRRFRELGLAHSPVDDRYLASALGGMVKEFCSQAFDTDPDLDFEKTVDSLTIIWATALGLDIPAWAHQRA